MAVILLWANTAAWSSRVTPSWCLEEEKYKDTVKQECKHAGCWSKSARSVCQRDLTGPQAQQDGGAGQPRGPAVLTSATLRLDVRPMAEAARSPLAANNQKLGLLAALMRVRVLRI